jgi:hypothetical protein
VKDASVTTGIENVKLALIELSIPLNVNAPGLVTVAVPPTDDMFPRIVTVPTAPAPVAVSTIPFIELIPPTIASLLNGEFAN